MELERLGERLSELIKPFVEEECLQLVEVRLRRLQKGLHLTVLVDRDEGGITLDTCVFLNKRIGEALEADTTLPGPYTLEVSSPGLDRNLKTERDFGRCLGRRVKFFLSQPVEGRLEWDGTVTETDPGSVTIQTGQKTVTIELVKINRARQVV